MKNGRATEAHVFLGVFKFGSDPEVVTALLQLEPSDVIIPDSRMPGPPGTGGVTWKHERWVLASPAGTRATIEDQLKALLPILESRRDAIIEASQRFEIGLMCAAYFRETNPGFHFDASLMARIASLQLDLDFDLYCLGEPNDNSAA